MARKKHKKIQTNKGQDFSAAAAAKKVRSLERPYSKSISTGSTRHRSLAEYQTSDNYITDETAVTDPDVTLSFYDQYQDERLKNMAVELEARSSEKISQVREHVANSLGDMKSEMLKWMFGTVIALVVSIVLGLVSFHFSSLSSISESLSGKFDEKIKHLTNKVADIEATINNEKLAQQIKD